MSASKALLVLENPWFAPSVNPKRASVLPFLQGLERVVDDFNIYYSTFYEREGFRAALEKDLTDTREQRLFLYIGAHGTPRKVGSIHISTVLGKVREVAKKTNIEGLVVSSCLVGNCVDDFKNAVRKGNLRWIFGYKHKVDWLTSTLVDLSILNVMMKATPADLRSETRLIRRFREALAKFNLDFLTASAGNGSPNTVALRDCVAIVLRSDGSRPAAKDVTSDVFAGLGQSIDPSPGVTRKT
jgi:hypothetical protein